MLKGVGTSNFTTTTGVFFHNVENVFWVHHYYDKNQTFNVLILPMASKKITTSKIKISTNYGVLPVHDVNRRSSYEGLESAKPARLVPEVLSGIWRGHSRESFGNNNREVSGNGRQEKAPLDPYIVMKI